MEQKRRYSDRELLRWMGEVNDFPYKKCENCRVLRDSVKRYSHPEADRVLEAFGKQTVNMCFVCFLKSIGVKVKEKDE